MVLPADAAHARRRSDRDRWRRRHRPRTAPDRPDHGRAGRPRTAIAIPRVDRPERALDRFAGRHRARCARCRPLSPARRPGSRIGDMSGAMLRLAGGQVVTPHGTLEPLDVTVADGTIVGLEPPGSTDGAGVLDVSGRYIAPGFIDLQLNGGWGHDFTSEPQSIGE